jgi:hypothetical protein
MCAAALILAVAGLAAVQVQSASATMCMVDCWDDGGGWSGGGGLGGGDGGGDPNDGVGGGSGGGQVGGVPDNSPSGTGWGDPRLPTGDAGTGGSEDAGTGGSGDAGTTARQHEACLVNVDSRLIMCQYRGNLACSVIGGKIGGGKGGAVYGACYAIYDQTCRHQQATDVESCTRT